MRRPRPCSPSCTADRRDHPRRWRTEAHWEWDFRDPVNHLAEDLFGLTMEQCGLDVLRTEEWKLVHFGAPPRCCRRCCSTCQPTRTRS